MWDTDSDEGALAGDRRDRRCLRVDSCSGRSELSRQTEVQNLRAGLGEHDVAGLQVSVDHSLAMGCLDGLGDLAPDSQYIVDRQGTLPQPILEGFPH